MRGCVFLMLFVAVNGSFAAEQVKEVLTKDEINTVVEKYKKIAFEDKNGNRSYGNQVTVEAQNLLKKIVDADDAAWSEAQCNNRLQQASSIIMPYIASRPHHVLIGMVLVDKCVEFTAASKDDKEFALRWKLLEGYFTKFEIASRPEVPRKVLLGYADKNNLDDKSKIALIDKLKAAGVVNKDWTDLRKDLAGEPGEKKPMAKKP